MQKFFIILFIPVAIILFSCRSIPTPEEIPADLSAQQLFKMAQTEVVSKSNYKAALVYYDVIKSRFKDDREVVISADYEIAVIYYKQKDFTRAESLLGDIIQRYESADSEGLPKWVLVLAKKKLTEIQNRGKKKSKEKPAEEARKTEPATAAE